MPPLQVTIRAERGVSEMETIKRWLAVLLGAACLLLPRIAGAQVLTGGLIGAVKDEQGAVIPNAVVRVTSPALIGAPSTTGTNESGQFRFPVLTPGPYTLEVELPGFGSYREQDVRIGVGATLERKVILKVARVAESISVETSGSSLEARGSGFETHFGQEYLRTIPTRR